MTILQDLPLYVIIYCIIIPEVIPMIGKKVIIAEDEALVLLGFKTLLVQLGYDVVGEAYDGHTAVSLCKELNPDFLIMDIKMPGLDGIQALEQINQDRAEIIPCIFVTAHSDEYLIERAKHAGAFSYLIKPVRMESLCAAINIALERFEDYKKLSQERDRAKDMLEQRKLIERAKGYLMDNFDMKEKQAMEFMQKKSCTSNKKLIEVARAILQMAEKI